MVSNLTTDLNIFNSRMHKPYYLILEIKTIRQLAPSTFSFEIGGVFGQINKIRPQKIGRWVFRFSLANRLMLLLKNSFP